MADPVQTGAASARSDPAVIAADAIARALRSHYTIARRGEEIFKEAEKCAEGDKYERKEGVLSLRADYDKCTSACANQGCLGKCYAKAGGKASAEERIACWKDMPVLMAALKNELSNTEPGCPGQVRKAVSDGLDVASRQVPEATGYMKPFPWGTIHDGVEPCSKQLFRCGKLTKQPCPSAALTRMLGLREPELPSEATYRSAAARNAGDLYLSNGAPVDLSVLGR